MAKNPTGVTPLDPKAVPVPVLQAPSPAPVALPSSIGSNVLPQLPPPAPPTTPQAQQKLQKDWMDYLKDPEVLAGMIQFGIDVGQPVAPGQTTLGHITGSIAGGGEAIGRVVGAREKREDVAKKQSQKDRELELEDLRTKAQAKAEADKITVRREEITAKRAIEKMGIDAWGVRLDKEIAAKIDLDKSDRDASLMTSIQTDAINRYKACTTAFIPGRSQPCIPPTTSALLQKFKVVQGARDNEGIVPDDGRIPDKTLVDQLLSGNPQLIASARGTMGFLTPEQNTRINVAVSKLQSIVPPPELITSSEAAENVQERAKAQPKAALDQTSFDFKVPAEPPSFEELSTFRDAALAGDIDALAKMEELFRDGIISEGDIKLIRKAWRSRGLGIETPAAAKANK